MKTTWEWLNRHIKMPIINLENINKISNTLTNLGIEVEAIKLINGLVCVKILSAEQITKKLKKCIVKLPEILGGNSLQILCGGINAREGLNTILALDGTFLPAINLTIASRMICGHLSEGMLCSPEETGFPDKFEKIDGIAELDYCDEIFHCTDVLFDLSVPANRNFSVRDIGELIGILFNEKLKPLSIEIGLENFPITITNKTKELMEFVSIESIGIHKEIPMLLQRINKKSLNPLQQLHDFILLDLGQPIHIYDLDKTKLLHIDYSNEKVLMPIGLIECENNVLICDQTGPICVGGISGFGFTENTKNVIIECARFSSEVIHKVCNESAKAFWLGVNPENPVLPYILSLTHGIKSKILFTGTKMLEKRKIFLSQHIFQSISGYTLSLYKMKELLEKISIECEITMKKQIASINEEAGIDCIIPLHRMDIINDINLIEEILRFNSYELPEPEEVKTILDFTDPNEKARNLLISLGFNEVYNLPFTSSGIIKLTNSMNIHKQFMRDSLFEGMYERRGEWFTRIFEIGKIYYENIDGLPTEKEVLGILMEGNIYKTWNNTGVLNDYGIKSVLHSLGNIYHIDLINMRLEDKIYKINCGFFGVIKDVYYAEIELMTKIEKNVDINTPHHFKDMTFSFEKKPDWYIIEQELEKEQIVTRLFDIYDNTYSLTISAKKNEEDLLKKQGEKIVEIMKKFKGILKI